MAEKLQEYSLTWVLSTPNMVALMEAAALELAKSYLEEGQTTVGAEIQCGEGSHLRIMVNSKAMSDKAASKAE